MPLPRFRRLVSHRRPPLLRRADFGRPSLLRTSPRNSDRGRTSSFPFGFPTRSTPRRVIGLQLGRQHQPSKNRPAYIRSKDVQTEFCHTLLCRPLELSALVRADHGFYPKRLLESTTQQDYCECHQQEHQPGYGARRMSPRPPTSQFGTRSMRCVLIRTTLKPIRPQWMPIEQANEPVAT